MHAKNMLSAARGIHGGPVEPMAAVPLVVETSAPEMSLRDSLKKRLSDLVDEQFTDDELEIISRKTGHFDWIVSGAGIHFVRVKKTSGCVSAK